MLEQIARAIETKSVDAKQEALKEAYAKNERFIIDEKIKDTIAYLTALGFHTVGSCEGHIDHGTYAPYVQISTLDMPKYQWENQGQIFEEVCAERGVTAEEVLEYLRPKYGETDYREYSLEEENFLYETWEKAFEATPKENMTQEFKKWRAEMHAAKDKLDALLVEFYLDRAVSGDLKLILRKDDLIDQNNYFFLQSAKGIDIVNPDPEERKKISAEEKTALEKHLNDHQKEMHEFTEFLKKKYLAI